MKKILIVDDEPQILEGLRRILHRKRDEWTLFFASSFNDALELLQKEELDAVLTDVNMPGRSGLDLLALIRSNELWEDIAVVVFTGVSDRAMKARTLLACPC